MCYLYSIVSLTDNDESALGPRHSALADHDGCGENCCNADFQRDCADNSHHACIDFFRFIVVHALVQYRCCCTVLEEFGMCRRLKTPAQGIQADRVLVPEDYVQFCDSCVVGLRSASNCTVLYCIPTVFVPSRAVLYFTALCSAVLWPGLVSRCVCFRAARFRRVVRGFVRE